MSLGCQRSNPSVSTSEGAKSATDAHGHDEVSLPADFSAGVKELDRLHSTIVAAYTENQPENAHDALHVVGEVLELLPQLAEKAAISGDGLAAVRDATHVLADSFTTLDDAMHDEKPVEFEPIKQKLADAMTRLQEAAAAIPVANNP